MTDSDGSRSRYSRRQYLAVAGTVGGLALGAGPATAQETATATPSPSNRITRRFVIPGIERFEGEYRQDTFVHVLGTTDVTRDWADVKACGFDEWSPEQITAFRMSLIDTLKSDPEPVETAAFVNTSGSADVRPGSLYIINDVHDCPGRYVGLDVEWVSGDVYGLPTDEGRTGVLGPGFGVAGALAGLVGGGIAYLSRHRDE